MASEVDICNLALSHFGQDASIDAIDPPDGSVEAEHCSIFYPIARDQQLELMPWTFATQRAALTEVTNDRDDWGYRYVLPTGCIKPRIVLPDGYTSTEDDGVPFEREGDSIYANESGATLVYTFRQTDPTKFNPGFVTALSWLLASYVSGPILKDPTGRIQASLYQRWEQRELPKAAASNIATTRTRAAYTPTAQRARR